MKRNPEPPGTPASLRILVHMHQAGRPSAPAPERLCPLTGRVTAQVGEERLEVAWGDEQYKSSPRDHRVGRRAGSLPCRRSGG
jgi:hypothetical protein